MCTIAGKIKAQDVITLKDGSEIKAKVTEINTLEVRYKKWDNPEGPVFVIEKSNIFMIKYENGTKDIVNPIQQSPPASPQSDNKPTMPYIEARPAGFVGVKFYDATGHRIPTSIGWDAFKKVPAAFDMTSKAKSTEIVASIFLLAGCGLIIDDLLTHNFNDITVIGYTGLGLSVFGFILEPGPKLKKASKLYNSSARSSFFIGAAKHGYGITYNF
jgi:hypothetical protein